MLSATVWAALTFAGPNGSSLNDDIVEYEAIGLFRFFEEITRSKRHARIRRKGTGRVSLVNLCQIRKRWLEL